MAAVPSSTTTEQIEPPKSQPRTDGEKLAKLAGRPKRPLPFAQAAQMVRTFVEKPRTVDVASVLRDYFVVERSSDISPDVLDEFLIRIGLDQKDIAAIKAKLLGTRVWHEKYGLGRIILDQTSRDNVAVWMDCQTQMFFDRADLNFRDVSHPEHGKGFVCAVGGAKYHDPFACDPLTDEELAELTDGEIIVDFNVRGGKRRVNVGDVSITNLRGTTLHLRVWNQKYGVGRVLDYVDDWVVAQLDYSEEWCGPGVLNLCSVSHPEHGPGVVVAVGGASYPFDANLAEEELPDEELAEDGLIVDFGSHGGKRRVKATEVSTTKVCAVASKLLLEPCVAAATAPKPVIASALEKTNGTLGAELPNLAQFVDPALAPAVVPVPTTVAAQGPKPNPLETKNLALSVEVRENAQTTAEREASIDAFLRELGMI